MAVYNNAYHHGVGGAYFNTGPVQHHPAAPPPQRQSTFDRIVDRTLDWVSDAVLGSQNQPPGAALTATQAFQRFHTQPASHAPHGTPGQTAAGIISTLANISDRLQVFDANMSNELRALIAGVQHLDRFVQSRSSQHQHREMANMAAENAQLRANLAWYQYERGVVPPPAGPGAAGHGEQWGGGEFEPPPPYEATQQHPPVEPLVQPAGHAVPGFQPMAPMGQPMSQPMPGFQPMAPMGRPMNQPMPPMGRPTNQPMPTGRPMAPGGQPMRQPMPTRRPVAPGSQAAGPAAGRPNTPAIEFAAVPEHYGRGFDSPTGSSTAQEFTPTANDTDDRFGDTATLYDPADQDRYDRGVPPPVPPRPAPVEPHREPTAADRAVEQMQESHAERTRVAGVQAGLRLEHEAHDFIVNRLI